MPGKCYFPSQIINYLVDAEVLLSNAKTIAQVCKKISITD